MLLDKDFLSQTPRCNKEKRHQARQTPFTMIDARYHRRYKLQVKALIEIFVFDIRITVRLVGRVR